PFLTLSMTGCTPGTPLIVTGTLSRRANSRARSAAGPLTSPVFASVTACTGLPPMKVARSVPVGTRSSALATGAVSRLRATAPTSLFMPASCVALARERGALGERVELGERNVAAHRRHAAVGAGDDAIPRHVFECFANRRSDFFWRLDGVGRDINRADQYVLAVEELQQTHRHMRIAAFDRHLIDAARRQRGEYFFILAPLVAERRLPVGIGLDAVAVADVDRGLGADTFDRAVERRDAPVLHLVHVDVEGGLVELDHVDAVGREAARLFVEQTGECHRHGDAVAVVLVGNRVDDGHRPRQGKFELARRM